MKKLFFDTEFSGMLKDTTLISIGVVDEDGRSFYAEFGDFNDRQVDEWILANVVEKLRFHGKDGKGWCTCSTNGNATEVYGNKVFITECLEEWLQEYAEDGVQFVSDVCHYDFVLLIDLWGHAFSLPKFVNPVCHDINQDIAKFLGVSEEDAFAASRVVLAGMEGKVDEHNALGDAMVIRALHEELQKPDSKNLCETGICANDGMTFGHAIEAMKRGEKVARKGWNGKGMYIAICEGGGFRDGFRNTDFIYMKTTNDEITPWLASQADMLAEDWQIVK